MNWTPLVPQRVTDPPSLRLVRAAMLAPDGTNAIRHAQGELLNAAETLRLFNEEVPREGVKVTRQFERTRWIGGSTLLWVGLKKRVGRGEGSSALRFNRRRPLKPAGAVIPSEARDLVCDPRSRSCHEDRTEDPSLRSG